MSHQKKKKQAQRDAPPCATGEVAEDGELNGGANSDLTAHLKLKTSETNVDLCVEALTETSGVVTSLVDGTSQTDLDFQRIMENTKTTIHRFEMKVSRLKQALQALQEKHDEACECLQRYDDIKEIQQFLNVLEAAEQGDKKGLFIKNQVS